MPQQAAAHVAYAPGMWVAVAGPDVWLLAETTPDGKVASGCWQEIERGGGMDAVLGVIMREGLRSVPSFALAGRTASGTRLLVSGLARAEVRRPGEAPLLLDSGGAPTWIERQVDGPSDVRLSAGHLASTPSLGLAGGVVLASSLSIGTGEQAEAADAAVLRLAAPGEGGRASHTRTLAPPSEPGTQRDAVVLTLHAPPSGQPVIADAEATGAAADRRPGPLVPTVRCAAGHPNPPHATSCRTCGSPVEPQEVVPSPRPVLGTLRLSTGVAVPLDRDVVLGRAPFDPAPAAQRPHLIQLAGTGTDISRSHLRIALDGWQVLVIDLGSVNGTVVTVPGAPPVRLRPQDPLAIVPGTTISIADEVSAHFDVAPA